MPTEQRIALLHHLQPATHGAESGRVVGGGRGLWPCVAVIAETMREEAVGRAQIDACFSNVRCSFSVLSDFAVCVHRLCRLLAGILSMPQLLAKKLCSFGHSAQSTVLNSLHALTMQNKMHIAPSHLVILASPDWFATSWIIQVGCTHNLLCLAFKTPGLTNTRLFIIQNMNHLLDSLADMQ